MFYSVVSLWSTFCLWNGHLIDIYIYLYKILLLENKLSLLSLADQLVTYFELCVLFFIFYLYIMCEGMEWKCDSYFKCVRK